MCKSNFSFILKSQKEGELLPLLIFSHTYNIFFPPTAEMFRNISKSVGLSRMETPLLTRKKRLSAYLQRKHQKRAKVIPEKFGNVEKKE